MSEMHQPLTHLPMEKETIREIVELALASADPRCATQPAPIDGKPFVLVPPGYKVEDMEQTLPQPGRIRAKVHAQDVASFCSYVNLFKMDGPTIIFASVTNQSASFVAVLDWHEPGEPSWATHRVGYDCPLSNEWRLWAQMNGQKFTQEDFARFIETNQLDIIEPPGAKMLEIASTLEAATSIKFASAIRLHDGTKRLHWAEDTVSKGGENATLDVPKELTLMLAPFLNGTVFKVQAHLRHSVANGQVSFSYELIRPHKVIEAATAEVRKVIEEITKIKPLLACI